MARMIRKLNVVLLLSVCFINTLNQVMAKPLTEIEFVNDDRSVNQVPYFDNRFRIDARLDEITLLFYRHYGSAPIILVKPDGTKIKVNDHPKDTVTWFDDTTFDMVKIKKPMPGPWQAIGQILPKSKIMVISDIKLEVTPLPEILLAGETVKITATLHNGSEAIIQPTFNNVVNLDVDFYSTNNTEFDNFGSDAVQLTSFRDDGKELDEYAGDGIFTGEFDLKIAAGEWDPVYSIELPMATRVLNQQSIILRPSPVDLKVDITNDELDTHKIKLLIDKRFVKPESLIFQGKITYPNKHSEPFSIMENEGLIDGDVNTRFLNIGYTDSGIHRLNINAFGETINGREFRLALHEFTFNVDQGIQSDVSDEGEPLTPTKLKALNEQLKQQQAIAEQENIERLKRLHQEKQELNILIIIIGNVILLLLAAIGGWLYYRKKKAR
jgi:uncharacterized protein (TIGR03503 family)